jgi:hypothetical protein
MKSKWVISTLKVLFNVGFYLMAVVTLCFLVGSVINMMEKNKPAPVNITNGLTYEVLAFGKSGNPSHVIYSPDSSFHYQPSPGKFQLEAMRGTALGYYTVFYKFIQLLFATIIFWMFGRIFKEIKPDNPFKLNLVKYLKVLAALFITSDLIRIPHYVIFNQFVHRSLSTPRFELLVEIGNGIIIGLIVWVVAIIYQRGVILQTENDLTV